MTYCKNSGFGMVVDTTRETKHVGANGDRLNICLRIGNHSRLMPSVVKVMFLQTKRTYHHCPTGYKALRGGFVGVILLTERSKYL